MIELAYTVDMRYLAPLCASLCSVLAHLSPQARIRVHVIGSVSSAGQRALTRIAGAHGGARLEFLDVDASPFRELPLRNGKSVAIYYVLAIPRLLPDLDRIIYLDADVIVQADLSELWSRDVGRRPCLGVIEPGGGRAASDVRAWRELGMAPDTPCLNSGVLVLNLRAWRDEGLSEKVIAHMKTRPTRLHDQEGINAVLKGDWDQLEPEWNVCSAVYATRCVHDARARDRLRRLATRLKADTKILHFNLTRKPWHVGCPRIPRRLFLRYLKMSGCLSRSDVVIYRARLALLKPFWLFCAAKDMAKRVSRRWRMLPARYEAALRPLDLRLESWLLVLPRIRD